MKYLSLILIFGLLFFGGCTEETKTGTNETGTTVKLEDYTYFFNENDTSIDPSFPCHYAGCGENGEGMYDIFEGVEEKGECKFNEDCSIADVVCESKYATKHNLKANVLIPENEEYPKAECVCLEEKCRWAVKK